MKCIGLRSNRWAGSRRAILDWSLAALLSQVTSSKRQSVTAPERERIDVVGTARVEGHRRLHRPVEKWDTVVPSTNGTRSAISLTRRSRQPSTRYGFPPSQRTLPLHPSQRKLPFPRLAPGSAWLASRGSYRPLYCYVLYYTNSYCYILLCTGLYSFVLIWPGLYCQTAKRGGLCTVS